MDMGCFAKGFSSEGLSRRGFVGAAAFGGLTVGAGLAAATQGVLGGCAVEPACADELNANRVTAVPSGASERTGTVSPYAAPSVVFEEDRFELSKRVLIVVDYQVDFVDGGVFGTIEPAVAIEDALLDVIREYRTNNDIIIYTMDTHPSDHYEETREGTFNPPHCVPGTEGWNLYGKVRDLLNPDNAILVKKGTYGSRDLPFVLQSIQAQGVNIELVEFAGVSTTCRVLHNAIIVYNFFPELPMVFDARTTASYSDESTLDQLKTLAGWGFIVKHLKEIDAD